MLKGNLIHPELMAALSQCGHGDKVLIADGNYPLASRSGDARKIYLGLTPGLPDVPTVLKALQSVVAIERAEVMQPEDGSTPGSSTRCLGEKSCTDWTVSSFTRPAASPRCGWQFPPASGGSMPTCC